MTITSSQLLELSMDSDLVVADFQAEWCGPCKVMAPIIETLDGELPNVKFVAIDVDAEPLVASEFMVQSIPTFALFRDGQLVDRITGALPASELKRRILSHLSTAALA